MTYAYQQGKTAALQTLGFKVAQAGMQPMQGAQRLLGGQGATPLGNKTQPKAPPPPPPPPKNPPLIGQGQRKQLRAEGVFGM